MPKPIKILSVLFLLFFYFLSLAAPVAARQCSCVVKLSGFSGPGAVPATVTNECDDGCTTGACASDSYYVCSPVLTAQEQAQSQTNEITADINQYTPNLKVTIGGFSNFEAISCTAGQPCPIKWLSQYIAVVYQYGVALAAVLATIMIMIGGFLWLTSAGSPDRVGKAKDFIVSAFTGLLLALFSYMILYTVNPELVSLKTLQVQTAAKFTPPDIVSSNPTRDGSRGTDPAAYRTAGPTAGSDRMLLNENYQATPYLDPPTQSGCSGTYSEAEVAKGCTYSVGYGSQINSHPDLATELAANGGQLNEARAREIAVNDWNNRYQNQAISNIGTAAWNELNQGRRDVLTDIAYTNGSINMPGVVSAVQRGDFNRAAEEIKWHNPDNHAEGYTPYYLATGNRAERNMYILRNGTQP